MVKTTIIVMLRVPCCHHAALWLSMQARHSRCTFLLTDILANASKSKARYRFGCAGEEHNDNFECMEAQ